VIARIAIPAGALMMLLALPHPWTSGYVSEAGVSGQPHAILYRAGLILLAAGVAALAIATKPRLLLGAAATMAATSGAVPCSKGCPLPPYEPTTVTDVVHTSASILGMILLAGAMVWAGNNLAGAAATLTIPLGGWLGLIMLFVGRGQLGATLERILLVIAVAWLTATAWLNPPHDREQRLLHVFDGAFRREHQPVDRHDQADAEER